MVARLVAGADEEFLKSSRVGWVLGHALRLAVATAVISLILATTLQGVGAERLATTAYLAGIFAAIALVIQRFLPAGEPPAVAQAFPAFLTFFVTVALIIGVTALLVSDPGAETILIAACLGIVGLALLVRSGSLAALNAMLVRGGRMEAAARYAVGIAVFALVLAALLPSDLAGGAANVAYRLLILAALFVGALLIAPTRAGLALRQWFERFRTRYDRLADAFVFKRAASLAAIIAGAVLVIASVVPGPFAEPFAVTAYLAAAFAVVCIAVECRRLRE